MITIDELTSGILPSEWFGMKLVPPRTGFYETLCSVGSVNAKVMILTKMYKLYDYTDDNGDPCGRWMEGDWIAVYGWRERKL